MTLGWEVQQRSRPVPPAAPQPCSLPRWPVLRRLEPSARPELTEEQEQTQQNLRLVSALADGSGRAAELGPGREAVLSDSRGTQTSWLTGRGLGALPDRNICPPFLAFPFLAEI